MNKTVELCPFCESEVELLENLKPQKCPECKKMIMPCTYCNDRGFNCDFRWLDEERTKGTCRHRQAYQNEGNKCECWKCELEKECIHNGAFRRLPRSEGGLGLCPKMKD
jgi:DNA-directed RNA polymerase subunit RPC12/RpoP